MDVAISGSHGLIGTALAHDLRAGGHRVRRLVRPGSEPSESSIAWDPAAGTIDEAALEGVDAVVHLAGAGIGDKRWSEARKRELVESRVEPTRRLAQALARLDRPPQVLVSASGINIYGDHGDEIITEASALGHDFLADLCQQWEAATEPARDRGIRVNCIRSGVVLSPDGGALARQLPFFRLGLGGRMGSGQQYDSWIALDDEVGAIRWLLDHELEGPVNLCAPQPVRNAEFTEVLGRVLRRPTLVPTPMVVPKLMFGGELIEALVLASARVVPEKLQASGFAFAYPTLEPALRHLLDREHA
jgi:uncharacterized protein (TIGR01777 family)